MAKQVVLVPTALSNYDNILEYLIENWGIVVVNDFIDRFIEVSKILSINPAIYPFANRKKRIQRCVLTSTILYFFENWTIVWRYL